MAKKAKTWTEKMAKPPPPEVLVLAKDYARQPAGTRMLISSPAWERMAAGAAKDDVTPFWRIVSPKDALAKKLSCGVDELAHLRQLEGIG